ncbi:MAG TPA: flagellar hook-associated protein FlgK, partial [Nevskiaceae bacterium]
MADMLSIGSSALMAYQRALNTVSNNVANANTPGYSREIVQFQTRTDTPTGAGSFGAGVDAVGITRAQDPFANSQLWASTSAQAAAQVVASAATQVDNQFSSDDLSLAGPLNDFFDTLDAWASAPTDGASREAVLQSAQTLAARWTSTEQTLGRLQSSLGQQADATVSQVNTLTKQIAAYNNTIAIATGNNGGHPPNELLDKRDEAIRQLAGQMDISVVTGANGATNIYTGSGQALVLSTSATTVSLTKSPDTGALQVQLGSGASAITLPSVGGGALGGELAAMTQVVAPAQRNLTALANRITDAVNTVQAAGTDANGQPGAPIFSVKAPTVQPGAANSGDATLNASLANSVSWPAEAITFRFDGTTWTAVGVTTGKPYPLFGSGSSSDPLTGADPNPPHQDQLGLALTVTGTPQPGDRFTVDATSSGLAATLRDGSQLAAASPVTATPGAGNSGTAAVAQLQVTDPSNPDLRSSVSLQFTSPTQVSIDGAPPVAFNGTVAANGWSLTLSGIPAAGDQFTLSPT